MTAGCTSLCAARCKPVGALLGLLLGTVSATPCFAVDVFERQALIDLYNRTNGDSWTDNSGWKDPTGGFSPFGTECSWYGVECSNGHVDRIDLSENNLVGPVGDLTGLFYLTSLNVESNQLNGPLPDFSFAPHLSKFYASTNQLSGGIPVTLNDATEMQFFSVDHNLLDGEIPDISHLVALCHSKSSTTT